MTGGDNWWDTPGIIDRENSEIAAINNRIPSEIMDPNGNGSGPRQQYDNDTQTFPDLEAWRNRETQKIIKNLQGPTSQEQTQEAMRLIVRESAQGRVPDPDYDITPRSVESYAKVDTNALALQRARDYVDDLEQDLKRTKGEAYSQAERERIVANRQAEELKRLSENTATDEERTRARDDRRVRLLLGQTKLKPGSSLLNDDKTSSGTTLLVG